MVFVFPVEISNAGVAAVLLPMKIQSRARWKTVGHTGRRAWDMLEG